MFVSGGGLSRLRSRTSTRVRRFTFVGAGTSLRATFTSPAPIWNQYRSRSLPEHARACACVFIVCAVERVNAWWLPV